MSDQRRLSLLPYVLLLAMSFVCFGGPFAILVVVRGGSSPRWPPEGPFEWITIALVLGLFIALFLACLTIGWWYPPPRRTKGPRSR